MEQPRRYKQKETLQKRTALRINELKNLYQKIEKRLLDKNQLTDEDFHLIQIAIEHCEIRLNEIMKKRINIKEDSSSKKLPTISDTINITLNITIDK